MKITIEKLRTPERAGDWHDAPLRWAVCGPDSEVQKFSTKKDAKVYKRIRKHAPNFAEASVTFVLTT